MRNLQLQRMNAIARVPVVARDISAFEAPVDNGHSLDVTTSKQLTLGIGIKNQGYDERVEIEKSLSERRQSTTSGFSL